MIKIKNQSQIESMRKCWTYLKKIHESVAEHIRPWISTYDLELIAQRSFDELWVKSSFKWYRWYPCCICASPNEVVVHWIPSQFCILKSWDIISIDIWAYYEGVHTDSCRTYVIWDAKKEIIDLSKAVYEAMLNWIKKVKPWNHIGDIEHAVQKHLQRKWYCPIYDCTGHWVGEKLHEDPEILNYGNKWQWPLIKEWMCFAIEPSATLWSNPRTYNHNKDKWTLVAKDHAICAQWEHTVLVTSNGFEILT